MNTRPRADDTAPERIVHDERGEKQHMPQTVLITGIGRAMGLGFNLARRYLENGDTVFASVRRPFEALEGLQKEYPDRLRILTIRKAIAGIAGTRTIIAIAHRLSTIRSADRIPVIEKGRITERGTHDELIALNGSCARMNAVRDNEQKHRESEQS